MLPAELYYIFLFVARFRRQSGVDTLAGGIPNTTEADGKCRETAIEGVRLCGGDNEREGFLQLYNDTINAWSLMCDPQFNDRTAEV